MGKKAVYAGTFDPFTNGHLDIVKRALKIFKHVTILLAVSPSKTPFLSQEKRRELLQEIFKDEKNVSIDVWDGLVVDYAHQNQIDAIVRGLRPTGDFEVEFQMASMNRRLYPTVETAFFMTSENHYFVSSSLIKEIYNHGGDIKQFVPTPIFDELMKLRR